MVPVCFFCSCKDTSVLEQIIYRDHLPDVDPNVKTASDQKENTQKDDQLSAKKHDTNSKRQEKRQKNSAVQGNSSDTAEHVAKLKNNTRSKHQKTSGAKQKKNANSTRSHASRGQNTKKKGGQNGSCSEGDKTGGDQKNGGGSRPTNEGQGDRRGKRITGGDKNKKQEVIDSNGEKKDVPSNADQVTAVGEAAVMVEMLGGSNRLAGTSESLTRNGMARHALTDLKSDKVRTWWSGTGKDPIPAKHFQTLLQSKPAACFVISGEHTFTNMQMKVLSERKIPVVTLYRMSTADHVCKNVTLIGKVLGSSTAKGRKNAVAMARKYNQWYRDELAEIGARRFTDFTLTDYDNDILGEGGKIRYLNTQGNGFYGLFLQYWDSSARIRIYSNTDHGVIGTWSGGAPATDSGYSNSPLSYFMSRAGVVNSAAAEAARENLRTQKTWYVNGWENGECIVHINGRYNSYKASGTSSGPLLAQVYKNTQGNTRLNRVHLGSRAFPKVIAASPSIKKKASQTQLLKYYTVKQEKNYEYNGYRWKGFRMESCITGRYDIVTNPCGIASWTAGSVEAPLEMAWIGHQYRTYAVSESDIRNKVIRFYQTFYDYDLSDKDVLLDKILSGAYAE